MKKYPRAWICALVALAAGCSGKGDSETKAAAPRITVDGSSTVLPITQWAAERYGDTSSPIIEAVGSGTGSGFKKLCIGKVNIVGASRPISQNEIQACGAAGVHYIELPIAFDGIAV